MQCVISICSVQYYVLNVPWNCVCQDGSGRWGVAGGVARCRCVEEGEEVVVGPSTLPANTHQLQEWSTGGDLTSTMSFLQYVTWNESRCFCWSLINYVVLMSLDITCDIDVFAGLSSTMSFWVFWRHLTLLFLFLLVSNQLFRFDVTWHDCCCFCCSLINYSMSFVQYVTWHDDYFRWCWF